MADEAKQDAIVEDIAEEEAPETQQAKTGKVFTQEDVNKLISREKAGFKRQKEAIEAEVTSRDGTIAKYEEILTKQVEAQIAELPELEQKIIRKLPLLEQLEILGGDEMKVSKKQIPPTPKRERKEDDFVPSKVDKVI